MPILLPRKPSKKRLLICEDYENLRMILSYILVDHEVDFAVNTSELMAKLDGQDLILLDINIDGTEAGLEILPELKRHAKAANARIVAFTAHNLPGQREKFLAQGFDDHLPKPFEKEQLLKLIEDC